MRTLLDLSRGCLERAVSQFLTPNVDVVNHPDGHVLVVGDVAVEPSANDAVVPAGAAQATFLLADLGYTCSLTGFVGSDQAGVALLRSLQARAISTDILAVPQWPTYVASSQSAVTNQEAVGEAPEQQRVLPFNGMSEYQAHLQNRVERGIRNASRLVVVDQGYGSVGDPPATVFAAAQHQIPSLVLCAPHQARHYIKASRVVEVGPTVTSQELVQWLRESEPGFNGPPVH